MIVQIRIQELTSYRNEKLILVKIKLQPIENHNPDFFLQNSISIQTLQKRLGL